MMTRRQAIQKTAFATAAVAVGSSLASAQAQTAAGPFTLPLKRRQRSAKRRTTQAGRALLENAS